MQYVLKQHPEDFVVREVARAKPLLLSGGRDQHAVFELEKRGLTTIDALSIVEAEALPRGSQIGHAGLKDEDAVTFQHITVATVNLSDLPSTFRFDRGDDYVVIRRLGVSSEPMAPGSLEGNSFWVRARHIDPTTIERLVSFSDSTCYLLNYYDTQRFGLPDGPKTTHLVGDALLAHDYGHAKSLLQNQLSPEAVKARDWIGSPETFFQSLDQRLVSLYLSAASSHQFNARLAADASRHMHSSVELQVDGLSFIYGLDVQAGIQVLHAQPHLSYERFVWAGQQLSSKRLDRPTVIAVRPHLEQWSVDGESGCDLSFLLPSGCYATAVVRQLVTMAQHQRPTLCP